MVNAVRLTGYDRLPRRDCIRILCRAADLYRSIGRVKMTYRVVMIVSGALALAACSSSSDWKGLDVFKSGPIMDTVRFESEPPGAEARTSTGQTCRTPCALALPTEAPMTVTFSLNGYQPASENIEPIVNTGSPPQLRPNPVVVELTPAPPTKPVKKPATKKKRPARTSAARPKPAAAAAPAPATVQQQPAPSPWPSTPPQQR